MEILPFLQTNLSYLGSFGVHWHLYAPVLQLEQEPCSKDPVGRKFVLLVDFDGLGMSSLITGSIVRDLIGVMQASLRQVECQEH